MKFKMTIHITLISQPEAMKSGEINAIWEEDHISHKAADDSLITFYKRLEASMPSGLTTAGYARKAEEIA